MVRIRLFETYANIRPVRELGSDVAIFEAVHGSAPKYAGRNVINPTAVILSSVMMLKHLGEFEAAETVEHAVLSTLQHGQLTGDVVGYDKGVSTSDYTKAIIGNLGNLGNRVDGYTVRRANPIVIPPAPKDPVTVRPTRSCRPARSADTSTRAPPPSRHTWRCFATSACSPCASTATSADSCATSTPSRP